MIFYKINNFTNKIKFFNIVFAIHIKKLGIYPISLIKEYFNLRASLSFQK